MKKLLIILISVGYLISGCSNRTPKDYLEQARQYISEENVEEAFINYETIIKEFPNSEFAPVAMAELAGLYQNKLIKNLTEKQSLEKAIQLFINVSEKYPQSSEAPKSLFMAAFIQANELNNYPEATKLYNLFIEKYPKHQLVASAKEELNYMGLSPDEILKKKNLVK